MYTKVMRNQFEIKDGVIIHTPTGADFTPVTGTDDSNSSGQAKSAVSRLLLRAQSERFEFP
jgi:hypothetical protein